MDIQYLKGVGPSKAKKINKLNLFTSEDLFNYYPVKYEDRRVVKKIIELENCKEKKVLLEIKLFDYPKKQIVKKNMTIIKAIGKDDTGFITLTFFNQKFLLEKLNLDDVYYVYGNVKTAYKKFEMINPEIETVEKDYKKGMIMPIYSLTKGLTNNELTKIIKDCIVKYYDEIENILPDYLIEKHNLIQRKNAIKNIHFPRDEKMYAISKKTLAFERLLIMQLRLLTMRGNIKSAVSGSSIKNSELSKKLLSSLPYNLTNAQLRVIQDIEDDMALEKPMNRLVQGDVGSGKTVVAIYAMLLCVASGFQASMMAPTEILALQHYDTLREYLQVSSIDIEIAFLSGSTKKSEKKTILKNLIIGKIQILIGTHAILEEDVVFRSLGLAITDEQHRFGVRQRAILSNKGKNPDVLVMSATPIPRTLALIVYADLDISIIDEMPPGRQAVKTFIVGKSQKYLAFDFIKKQLSLGRQAYIVAPLVENSEKMELYSAKDLFDDISKTHFSEYKLGLLHGKMKNSEKEEVMDEFYKGQVQILVSTTVIEVGVNVKNASVMLVLNSDRFGLAQLHQLRGRVGRGEYQSYCILYTENESKKSKDRMNILKNTNDGFIIAEEDLKQRGPGDFFGVRQHGISTYEIQNIISDVKIVEEAQLAAKEIYENDKELSKNEYKKIKREIINLSKDENIVLN